jgi:Saccharopine dehydrogenase NADP binding domain
VRVVVLGGAGNFGARITRALREDPNIELLVAGRRGLRVPGAEEISGVALDIKSPGFESQLRALSPGLVIHCVGPFQGQDYTVAQATLAAGAHYLDLADGRQFVAEFAGRLNGAARLARRTAISGASTLPALSSAVADELRLGMSTLESIEIVIAPGQRAARGEATLRAVFSYLGRPFRIWRNGTWSKAWGWMGLKRTRLDFGTRLAAACDVPDLELFPVRYAGVRTVCFHAALEFAVQHLALWSLAGMRRMGLQLPVDLWALRLNRVAGWFDAGAGENGGMSVSVVGHRRGSRVRRTWQLVVPAIDGPEIPCIPAVLLARRLAAGEAFNSGAFACTGFVALSEFVPAFDQWNIVTRIEQTDA